MADGNGLDHSELQSPGGTALYIQIIRFWETSAREVSGGEFYTMIVLSGEKILTTFMSTLAGVLYPTYIYGILVAL